MSLNQAVTYMTEDMEAIVSFDFCGGTVCAYTAKSPDKETVNEDSVALIPCGNDSGALVVADGLGGMRCGDVASEEVVNSLVRAVRQRSVDCSFMREAVLDGIELANRKISGMKNGAASTVAVVEIQQGKVRPYLVGDTAIIITGQRGRVKYQSVPHSPVGYAVESGLLEADDALFHDERHLVSNAVGIEPMHVEVGPIIKLAVRDTVLVASDGVFDNLVVDEIIDIIRQGPLSKTAEKLVSICRSRMLHSDTALPHKPDDMSFILYRPVFDKRQAQPELDKTS